MACAIMKKIQHRKEAYTAARELSGAWGVEHSLVSLRARHDKEEIELSLSTSAPLGKQNQGSVLYPAFPLHTWILSIDVQRQA